MFGLRLRGERHTELAFGALAHAYVAADAERLATLRKNPGSYRGQPIPANQLKHVDDQTVLALAAALAVAAKPALAERDLSDWSVLASPRFLGRANLAGQFEKYKAEGAWSMSPHSVPHRCLHSVSGALSQFMKLHGPNFGCGGGPGGDGEAFLAAGALLASEPIPGCLLLLVGHSPEHEPASGHEPAAATEKPWRAHALALALTPQPTADGVAKLRLTPPSDQSYVETARPDELLLLRLLPWLEAAGASASPVLATCLGGPSLRFEPLSLSGARRRAA